MARAIFASSRLNDDDGDGYNVEEALGELAMLLLCTLTGNASLA